MFTVPKFSTKDDPDLWLYRYTKAASMNQWNEKTMLQYVDNCFKQHLQLWFMDQDFKTWEEFKTAFIDKFSKKTNIDKILSTILNMKMTPQESVSEYIHRYEKLRLKYNNEIAKSQKLKKLSANSNITEKAKETKDIANAEVEFVITEAGFLKYFIKGLYSKDIKRLIKMEKPTTLEEAINLLKDVYGSEDEYDGDSSVESQSDDEQESDSTTEGEEDEKKAKSSKVKKETKGSMKAKSNEMADLISEFKSMTLLIGELVNGNKKPKSDVKDKRTTCWNCMSKEHYTRECTNPCKYCESTGHIHYQCSMHKKNNYNNNQTNKSKHDEAMLIEELYLSEKRKQMDSETINDHQTKRNVRVTRSGKEVPTSRLRRNTPKVASLVSKVSEVDTVMVDPLPNVTTNPNKNILPITTSVKGHSKLNAPKHPFLPLNNGDASQPKGNNVKIDQIVDRILNEPVHQVSLNDLASLSPVARSKLKSLMTKPQVNKSSRITEDQGNKVTTVLLSEESTVPKGKSAPRSHAEINGVQREVILDGGCTSFIISLKFAKELGIQEAEPCDTAVMFGDGKLYHPIGLIRDIRIKLGNTDKVVSVNALCYDVGDQYEFIIGREGLHALGVGTDWSTHYWYVRSEEGIIPLDIHYTKGRMREDSDSEQDEYHSDNQHNNDTDYYIDQDDEEEGYLVMEVSDDHNNFFEEKRIAEHTKDDRLGGLVAKIHEIPDLNEEEKLRLINLVFEYQDCFGTGYEHLGRTNLVKFHVDTGDARPIYRRPYSFLSFSEKEELKKDLEKMVNAGVLIPSTHVPSNSKNAGWSFPCRYVPKKTGDKRLITNFRELNKVTVRDPWPLPNVVDVIESLAKSKWYSVVDLLKAFQQIAVEEESIPKLTIATPWGNYSYTCVPFGVLNGPSCFSRCVYLAIQPFINSFATNYLDDVVMYGNDKETHFENIEKFLRRMREVNLKVNANKCDFFQKKIELLGFEVSENGVAPLKSKVEKIVNFPRPVNDTGIRAFVNLCGFYRRHIPGFADLSAPMNELLKKRNAFIWSNECEESFNKLKEATVKAFTLVIPDGNTKYNLYTDASEVGIGACLSAIMEDGSERPVVFISRKLLPAETRYPTVEKELLAVIYALRKLRKYLLDREFTLYCDNSAVCYLFNKNEPSQRLQRWVMCTQEFQFQTKHISSAKNSVADALSRFPNQYEDEDEETGEDHIDALFEHLMIDEVKPQYEDWLNDLVYYFKNPGNGVTTDATKRLSLKYAYSEDNIYRRVGARFVKVPRIDDRNDILNEIHEGHGHFGINASWSRLYNEFWWPNSYEDLSKHISSCRPCQLYSSPKDNPASFKVPVQYLFEKFSIDFVGPLPKTSNGNVHILVAIEAFSKWPIAIATPNTEAKTVADFLYKHIFTVFGPCTHLLSDNGAAFDNEMIDNYLGLLQVHHQYTSPYRPSTNGRTEQFNGTLTKALKKLSMDNPTNWDEHIDAVLYAYRTKAHSILKVSPYEFLYGIAPRSVRQDPLQMFGRSLGFERLAKLNDRNIQVEDYNVLNQIEYDYKHLHRNKTFEPGSKVVRVRHNKFSKMDSNYKPEVFTVIASYPNGTCQLADQVGRLLKRKINVSSLRQIIARE